MCFLPSETAEIATNRTDETPCPLSEQSLPESQALLGPISILRPTDALAAHDPSNWNRALTRPKQDRCTKAAWRKWANRALKKINAEGRASEVAPQHSETVKIATNRRDETPRPLSEYPLTDSQPRLVPFSMPRKHCRTVGQTLRPLTPYQRHLVRAAFVALGGTFKHLNDDLRAILSEAIFKVENDLEHRQPKHPQVAAMRTVRNRLYDDLGWNEYAKTKSTKPSKGISHAN